MRTQVVPPELEDSVYQFSPHSHYSATFKIYFKLRYSQKRTLLRLKLEKILQIQNNIEVTKTRFTAIDRAILHLTELVSKERATLYTA